MSNLIDIFSKISLKQPFKKAIYFGDEYLTYQQLESLSDSYAADLLLRGIKKNDVVSIMLTTDLTFIPIIFAIQKIGAIFTPLNSDFSEEKIKHILSETNSKFLITNQEVKKTFVNITIINVHELKENLMLKQRTNHKISYIMFTSGTTGKPKGVKVSHDNLKNLMYNLNKYFSSEKPPHFLLSTQYVFDVAMAEIYGWILGEGSLIIPNTDARQLLFSLGNFVEKYKITHLNFSPSIMEKFIKLSTNLDIKKVENNVEYIMLAGEELNINLAIKLNSIFNKSKIYNLYGPTETTVFATFYKIPKNIANKFVPIGTELDNYKIKIMNSNNTESNPNEKGEIWISGSGVSSGYTNQELTKEKFVELENNLYYKSGDLGIKLPDGNIIYKGRIDDQIQINGIRIEIGEIENTLLLNCKSIDDIKIIYYNNKILCFYTSEEYIDKSTLYELCLNSMPKYMIPNKFIYIEEFPYNHNGKKDKTALINYLSTNSKPKINTLRDQGKIYEIFCESLSKDNINETDNFFELGGDSLDSLQAVLLLENLFKCTLDESFIYKHPTIELIKNYFNKLSTSNEHTKSSKIKSTNIKESISVLESIYAKNNLILEEVIDIYKSYYLQEVYHSKNVKNIIDFQIPITVNEYKNINNTLNNYINKQHLLKSTLTKYKSSLFFKEFVLKEDLLFPTIEIEKYSELNEILEGISYFFKFNELNRLLYMFFIVKINDNYNLVCIFSNHICDLSSVNIIKKQINILLKGKIIHPKKTYKDFIQEINVEQKYYSNLNCLFNSSNLDLNFSDNKKTILKTPLNIALEKSQIHHYIEYIIGQIICNSLDIKKIPLTTIIDLRKGFNNNYKETIGNMHATLLTVLKKEDSFENYQNRIQAQETKYFDGFNPIAFIYNNFPVLTKLQSEFYKLYESSYRVKHSFIGASKDSPETIIKSLNNIRKNIKASPNFIVTSTFINKESIYIYIDGLDLNIQRNVKERFKINKIDL